MSEVDMLRKRIAELERENQNLNGEIKRLREENTALKDKLTGGGFKIEIKPSSFIQSIQQDLLKVDEFAMKQQRNTTYIISDFNIQLKAVVTRKDEGVIWALPSTQEDIKPELLSTINVSIKPIPLPYKEEPISPTAPAGSIQLPPNNIGDIVKEPDIIKRINEKGINTVQDLARTSSTTLAEIGIKEDMANKLINKARLIAKSEFAGLVEDEVAELLIMANINTREELKKSNSEELFNILINIINKDKRFKRVKLTLDDVKKLIELAQQA
jgi:hypothetical protein